MEEKRERERNVERGEKVEKGWKHCDKHAPLSPRFLPREKSEGGEDGERRENLFHFSASDN